MKQLLEGQEPDRYEASKRVKARYNVVTYHFNESVSVAKVKLVKKEPDKILCVTCHETGSTSWSRPRGKSSHKLKSVSKSDSSAKSSSKDSHPRKT